MRGPQPLPRSFYLPSAAEVARGLIGHWLLRRTPAGVSGGTIVETEAYLEGDPACHGAVGLTARNRVMFGEPGHAYVYFIYGCHFCVNAVCQPRGIAEAVLIRAIEPSFGEDWMREHRPVARRVDLTNGPAKLCSALAIDRRLDGADLCDHESELIIANNPKAPDFRRGMGPVEATTRIGISRAMNLPLRFFAAQSLFVSKHPDGSAKLRH
jgi:DNA-3-methyladenine glycosylase